MARTFFVGGNFKMNGSLASIKSIVNHLNEAKLAKNVEVVISPPAPYLHWTKEHLTAPTVEVAAQNVFNKSDGAYTGEISVDQIKDVGAKWVIIGHSERRTILKETDEFIASKTKFALDHGLDVILCIGESREERDAGKTIAVVSHQIDVVASQVKDWSHVVIAYEPVWAIGTGLSATPDDAEAVHKSIRDHIRAKIGGQTADSIRILYGGSVNGKNAHTFKDKADIDGFLVGGASLKPEFVDIINSRQ